MSVHNDAGNVGLYSGGAMGVGTTAGTMADYLTQNATLIGLGLTALSILIGVVFKIIDSRQKAKHDLIMQQQDAEYKRWLMSGGNKD